MSSVVYLLRSPAEQISRALYTAADTEAVVIRIDHKASQSPSSLAEVVLPGTVKSFTAGQTLSAEELLELLMNTPKIVTL